MFGGLQKRWGILVCLPFAGTPTQTPNPTLLPPSRTNRSPGGPRCATMRPRCATMRQGHQLTRMCQDALQPYMIHQGHQDVPVHQDAPSATVQTGRPNPTYMIGRRTFPGLAVSLPYLACTALSLVGWYVGVVWCFCCGLD